MSTMTIHQTEVLAMQQTRLEGSPVGLTQRTLFSCDADAPFYALGI